MPTELLLPKLSMSMTEGILTAWLKPNGAKVVAGDTLYTVETEKTSMDIESEESGELVHGASPGETYEAGAVVGHIIAPDERRPDGRLAAPSSPTEIAQAPSAPEEAPATPLLATPAARRLARERGIDLMSVTGSGPGGRIQESDIPDVSTNGTRASGMRHAIAQRMVTSLRDTAQFTVCANVAMDAAHGLRLELAQSGVRIGYLELVVAAAARSLRQHGKLNATMVGDAVEIYEHINVGIAVALDEGLVVPVLQNADRLPAAEIGVEIARLARAARGGELGGADYQGGTFTVSSLGGHGVTWFTPILNPPQVAILGIGEATDGVVWREDGTIQRQRTIALSLTVDHRAVDGVPAAMFLSSVAKYLDDPRQLLA